jgi:hypothetical protein
VSDGRRSQFNSAPTHAPRPQRFRDAVSELLVSLRSSLDALEDGSEQTRHIAHEMQMVIEEISQALRDGASD